MGLIESLIGIFVILWLVGFGFHIAGGLIHILLVIALVLFIFRMLRR